MFNDTLQHRFKCCADTGIAGVFCYAVWGKDGKVVYISK
jgi:hypothetical protein